MKPMKFNSIVSLNKSIKDELDIIHKDKSGKNLKKISILYASNASGKTRLSKDLNDKNIDEVLYYSAFTEDLFAWDNEKFIFKFEVKAEILKFIKDQGLDRDVADKFQDFIGTKLQPKFDFNLGQIIFGLGTGDDAAADQIKISRGEESIFIWSIFSTYLKNAIAILNEKEELRATKEFNKIKYVLIDDPVSSMDDSKIIAVALDVVQLISQANENIRFLITTHHALFFNVLFNAKFKHSFCQCFVLTKFNNDYFLKTQGNDSPFAYHHLVINEISRAIDSKEIKKYHLNLFRGLLEKTANFLVLNDWSRCLEGLSENDFVKKIINHYSHDKLSDLDFKELTDNEKSQFKEVFDFFIKEFKWGTK